MNAHSQERLKLVYPRLSDAIYKLSTQLAVEGVYIIVAQGLRTISEQQALWQKGRNADGSYIDPIHHTGVVTNAQGGHSYHNLGLAVDCDVLNKDGSIDWNPEHPAWKRMEALGVSLGMVSGANWVRIVDAPHFQITGRFPEGAPTDEVRQIMKDGGMDAVWAEVEKSFQ
jgi:peptidoglycan L-alanyl-D-glutamate endopeptidase CwlK